MTSSTDQLLSCCHDVTADREDFVRDNGSLSCSSTVAVQCTWRLHDVPGQSTPRRCSSHLGCCLGLQHIAGAAHPFCLFCKLCTWSDLPSTGAFLVPCRRSHACATCSSLCSGHQVEGHHLQDVSDCNEPCQGYHAARACFRSASATSAVSVVVSHHHMHMHKITALLPGQYNAALM